MAGFDYLGTIDAIVGLLNAANTTTADAYLSSGLSTSVQMVRDDDPEIVNLAKLKLPAVFVRISDKESAAASLGRTGPTGNRREATISWDIIGIIQKQGVLNTQKSLLRSVYQLAQNIEAVFENNQTMSGTALWCDPSATTFSEPISRESVIFKGCKVSVKSRHLYR